MKFKIEIQCDNSAFQPYPEIEIGRILMYVGNAVKVDLKTTGAVFDSNGNKVGKFSLK